MGQPLTLAELRATRLARQEYLAARLLRDLPPMDIRYLSNIRVFCGERYVVSFAAIEGITVPRPDHVTPRYVAPSCITQMKNTLKKVLAFLP